MQVLGGLLLIWFVLMGVAEYQRAGQPVPLLSLLFMWVVLSLLFPKYIISPFTVIEGLFGNKKTLKGIGISLLVLFVIAVIMQIPWWIFGLVLVGGVCILLTRFRIKRALKGSRAYARRRRRAHRTR